MSQIRFKVQRMPDGWVGIVELPTMPGSKLPYGLPTKQGALPGSPVSLVKVKAKSPSATKGGAILNAASAAVSLLDNPTVKALLPPGVGPALSAVKAIASNKALGKLAKQGGKAAFSAISKLFA